MPIGDDDGALDDLEFEVGLGHTQAVVQDRDELDVAVVDVPGRVPTDQG